MGLATEQAISMSRLICSGCGAETNATCNCGMDYKPKAARAREAVAANPEKSDRAIAKEIGVSHPTVGKARQEAIGNHLPVEHRTGLDGKIRKVPERIKKEPFLLVEDGDLFVCHSGHRRGDGGVAYETEGPFASEAEAEGWIAAYQNDSTPDDPLTPTANRETGDACSMREVAKETRLPAPGVQYLRENYLVIDGCGGRWYMTGDAEFGPFETKEAAEAWAKAQEKAPAKPDDLSIPDYLKR
jgi:hypothetical protein